MSAEQFQGREIGLEQRPSVRGVFAIDFANTEKNSGTRFREDAFRVDTTAQGNLVVVSIVDAACAIPKNSDLDTRASKGKRSHSFLPDDVRQAICFAKGEERPSITVSLPIDHDGYLGKPRIQLTKTTVGEHEALTHQDVQTILSDRSHEQHEAFTNLSMASLYLWVNRKKLHNSWWAHQGSTYSMVDEIMQATNTAVASYFIENDVPAVFKGRANGLSFYTPLYQSRYEPYAYMTSPVREYEALVNQRILTAHLQGESSPYTVKELNDIVHRLNSRVLSGGEMKVVYRREIIRTETRKKVTDKKKREERREKMENGEPVDNRVVIMRRKNVAPYEGAVPVRDKPKNRPVKEQVRRYRQQGEDGPYILNIGNLNALPRGMVVTVDTLISLGVVPEEAREKGVRIHASKDRLRYRLEISGISLTEKAERIIKNSGGRLKDVPLSKHAYRKKERVLLKAEAAQKIKAEQDRKELAQREHLLYNSIYHAHSAFNPDG